MARDSAEMVFTFALRVGDLLARNGVPSANVTHVILAITRTQGYPGASANVTMGQISLSLIPRDDGRPITLEHAVGPASFNLEAITATEQIVKDVVTGDLSVPEGLARLAEIEEADLGHTPWVQLAGWGLTGAGFAWFLGGTPVVCLLAALTAVLIELIGGRLTGAELPGFYAHLFAGGAAVAAAALTQRVAPATMPALVVTAALVTRLAGGAMLGATQDLLTGWSLTAVGRLMEVVLNTSGQVVGVLLTASAVARLGIRLNIEAQPTPPADLLHKTMAAVIVCVGFAVASQVRWRHMALVAVMSGALYLVYAGMLSTGWSRMTSAATAAAILGVVTVVAAPRVHIPSSGTLGVVLAPLLPGMLIYQGFVALALHHPGARDSFFEAAGVALATGAGAVLGQYLASQAVGRHKSLRQRRLRRLEGEDYVLDPHEGTAEWLSAPTFRRPFLADTTAHK